MNPRERLLTAIQRKVPDSLPVTTYEVQSYFINKYMNSITSKEFFDYFGFDPIHWTGPYIEDKKKAGMDAVKLKNKYKNKLAYLGNMDALNVLPGSKDNIKKDLLYRLNATKGGGFMPGADHSVPDNVSAENYDYFISLIREYGKYPLNLGEYDIEIDLTFNS